jgi:hypothetical protein
MIKNCKYKEITGRKQKSGLNPFISQCDQEGLGSSVIVIMKCLKRK